MNYETPISLLDAAIYELDQCEWPGCPEPATVHHLASESSGMNYATKNALDFTCRVRRILWVSRVSGRAGLLFAGSPAPRHRGKGPANAIYSKTERYAICRGKTYVCFRLWATVASQTCLTPETNCLLQDVNPDRSGEEKQGCLIRATGWYLIQHTRLTSRSIGSQSVPTSQERVSRREQSPSAFREGVCL